MYIEYLPTHEPDSAIARAQAQEVVDFLVDLDGETHSDLAADILCTASTWAYSDLETFASMMCRRGLLGEYVGIHVQNEPTFVDTSAYLYVSNSKKLVILTFRGTGPTNIFNWLSNFSTYQKPADEGFMHGGFLNAASAVLPFAKALLKALLKDGAPSLAEALAMVRREGCIPEAAFLGGIPERPISEPPPPPIPENILQGTRRAATRKDLELSAVLDGKGGRASTSAFYICGHSLGGAYAAMAGMAIALTPRLQWLLRHLRSIYTFGQPMFADETLANTLDARIGHKVFRHRYEKDIVPRLPAHSQGNYAHFGRNYTNVASGWSHADDQGPVRWIVSSNFIGILAWAMQHFPNLAAIPVDKIPRWVSWGDHSPLNYLHTSQARPSGQELPGPDPGSFIMTEYAALRLPRPL